MLRSDSVKTFVDDQTIRLPRFQRKKTWVAKQNFNLCVSVFKGFPMGVVVVKSDPGSGKARELVKWLLDGRQRLNALQLMRNPEQLYRWARDTIPLKGPYTDEEVSDAFWKYVDWYLGEEKAGESESEQSTVFGEAVFGVSSGPQEVSSDDDEDLEETAESEEKVAKPHPAHQAPSPNSGGLDELLEVILMVHPIRAKSSGLTRPFDFHSEVGGLDYVKTDPATGKDIVKPEELLAWIASKRTFQALERKSFPPTQEDFFEWLTKGTQLRARPDTLERRIANRWGMIERTLQLIDSLAKRLQECQIGILSVSDASDNDAMKIFEIINTAGTPLTAAEVLSAKPAWNEPVETQDPTLLRNKEDLYKSIDVHSEGIVKWDIAATLLNRLDETTRIIIGTW